MKTVIQRVLDAKVVVDGDCIGKINKGLLIFLGIGGEDDEALVDKCVDKITKLRIFEDENGKTNCSLSDVGGEVLVVSQFTLYANCKKGNRPSFIEAAPPVMAERLYEYFVEKMKEHGFHVECGRFGADMKVSLTNDGPFTILLDDTILR